MRSLLRLILWGVTVYLLKEVVGTGQDLPGGVYFDRRGNVQLSCTTYIVPLILNFSSVVASVQTEQIENQMDELEATILNVQQESPEEYLVRLENIFPPETEDPSKDSMITQGLSYVEGVFGKNPDMEFRSTHKIEEFTLNTLRIMRKEVRRIGEEVKVIVDSIPSEDKTHGRKGHRRTKRGWINIVGMASKTLFGVATEEDLYERDLAIQELQHIVGNQMKHLHQVALVLSTTERAVETLKSNQESIHSTLQQLHTEFMLRMHEFDSHLLIIVAVQELQAMISTMLHNVLALRTTTMDVFENKFGPSLLTPSEFLSILHELSKDNVKLPFPPYPENIGKYYDLVTVHWVKTPEYALHLYIELPLVLDSVFQMFRLSAAPYYISGMSETDAGQGLSTVAKIEVPNYIALSGDEVVEANELSCIHDVCKLSPPKVIDSHDSCAAMLFLYGDAAKCPRTYTFTHDRVKFTWMLAHWAVTSAPNTKTRVHHKCGSSTTALTVEGTVLLESQPGCLYMFNRTKYHFEGPVNVRKKIHNSSLDTVEFTVTSLGQQDITRQHPVKPIPALKEVVLNEGGLKALQSLQGTEHHSKWHFKHITGAGLGALAFLGVLVIVCVGCRSHAVRQKFCCSRCQLHVKVPPEAETSELV